MTSIASFFTSIFSKIATFSKRYPLYAILAVFVVVMVVFFAFSGGTQDTVQEERIPTVEVATITSLSYDKDPLTLLGEVRSVTQAELRTQKSGEVTGVYVTAGQYVPAGAILAEIDNAAERAAVLSAQGTVAAATAQYDKVVAGARSEDKATTIAQSQGTLITLASAQSAARSAYSQAYTLAQNAVFAQADNFFSDVYKTNPSFRVYSASYEERQELAAQRVEIGRTLAAWEDKTLKIMDNNTLDATLAEAEANLETVKAFLNRISVFVSAQDVPDDLTATEKSTQEAIILAARNSIDSARSVVNGARSNLAGALSAAQIASLTESKTITGARSEDVAAAEAAVTQARGALASAYAALENSIIRTPIAGTVTTLALAQGDFATAMQVAAVVANEGALEVESYVSASARDRITVGDKVLLDGVHEGVVTSVAPGLDPATKKARVTIGVNNDVELVNGSFVEIIVLSNTDGAVAPTEYSVPIAALKVLPNGLSVFTVTDENKLASYMVDEGPIVGSKMILLSDVDPELKIVTDVRGLREGDTVSIATNE